MKYLYENWSYVIFMGFYESYLFNSDTEYYINENLQDSEHPETYEINFDNYTKEISQKTTDLLAEYCISDDNIIKDMTFKELYSPKYYNYDRDRLNIEINFNLTKLKAYIKKNKSDFDSYLHDNFTSYDGFISYIENNYSDFMRQYKQDKNRCINVMLEYYILNCIYGDNWKAIKQRTDNEFDTPYHWQLFESNTEIQYNNLIEVKPEEVA